jgi:2-methylcitrate dehydratase PrpD
MLEPAARWAVASQDAPLSDEVRHHAKRAIVDWFAAVVPGGVMPPAELLTLALVDDRSVGDAELFPSGSRVPLRTAALVNGTAAHTAEVDDIFRDGVYHPGAPTIAAALAAAQDLHRTGEDLLRAVTVGFELSTRVAATIQPAHYRYWHTTGTVGTLGSAAAVGTLLRLDADQFVHAITNATTMAAGLQQAFRSDAMSKPLHAGHAAEAGALAALAAARGFTGAPDILEGAAGFGEAMSDGPSWERVFDDLDELANITLMTFKNHACCGHTFAAIDGALELRAEEEIDLDRIVRIEVETYGTAIKVAGNPSPRTAFEAQFSLPYTVAAALRLGSVRLAAFEPEMLEDPMLRSLVDRVTLAVDDELDAAFPTQRGARVRVVLEDGTEHDRYRPTRKGDPDLPLTDAELAEKFRELVEPYLGVDATSSLEQTLWSLDENTDLDHLLGGSD